MQPKNERERSLKGPHPTRTSNERQTGCDLHLHGWLKNHRQRIHPLRSSGCTLQQRNRDKLSATGTRRPHGGLWRRDGGSGNWSIPSCWVHTQSPKHLSHHLLHRQRCSCPCNIRPQTTSSPGLCHQLSQHLKTNLRNTRHTLSLNRVVPQPLPHQRKP